MVTSLLFVEKLFGGVRLTARPLKRRLSKREKESSIIAAKIVEMWLNDPINKLTILSLLSQLAVHGTAIGMSIGRDALPQPVDYKFFARPVIKARPARKTS